MNKNEIAEVINMLDLSSATAKPLINRLESALGKEGSASTRLSMAGSSLLALADKVGEDESGIVYFLGSFMKVVAEIARDNKTQESAPKGSHKPRENWYEADSPEAQEILAKTAPKPRKAKAQAKPALTPELVEALTALLNA